MRINKTWCKVILPICAIYSVPSFQEAALADSNSEGRTERVKLVSAWQRYFRQLRSLDFSFSFISPSVSDRRQTETYQYKFLMNGDKFRIDTKFPKRGNKNTGGLIYSISAYNGKQYQQLVAAHSGSVGLILSRKAQNQVPYGTTLPLMSQFGFAFGQSDLLIIQSLQKPQTWVQVAQRITRIEAGKWKEHRGKWVTIKGNKKYQQYKVFVENTSFFPLYVQGTEKVNTSKGLVTESGESEVVKSMAWQVGTSKFIFPLKIAVTGERSGDVEKFVWEVTLPVRINQPVKNNVFTLPRSQAQEIIDIDKVKNQASVK